MDTNSNAGQFVMPKVEFDKQRAVADLLVLRVGLQQIYNKLVEVGRSQIEQIRQAEDNIKFLWDNVCQFRQEYVFSAHL